MSINDIINRLAAAERDFLGREVLAPVLPGRPVRVRIAGIVCALRVEGEPGDGGWDERGEPFTGWAILQPLATSRARFVRPATLGEVAGYLRLLPAIPLITLVRGGGRDAAWLALPAHAGDARIRLEQPAPVWLAEESVQPFETVIARFDGSYFWYERRASGSNPATAAYLRQSLDDDIAPADLHRPGLTGEERAAYAWVWQLAEDARLRERNRQQLIRLDEALRHASGQLLSYIERDDRYTVTYEVDGARHISTVRKNDLTVLTSGICLSGRDGDFDLTSLVGVMREAADNSVPHWGADPDDEPDDAS